MTRHVASGADRHGFRNLVAVHASGGRVYGCRCGAELLTNPGQPRRYRRTPAEPWTWLVPAHVEPRPSAEVVVGDSPGHFPPDAGARWSH